MEEPGATPNNTLLQSVTKLSIPRLRIFFLCGLSFFLFLFVTFHLLPSAEIRVWPREDSISQTTNIFLVQSGALAEVPPRVRVMPLIPIEVTAHQAMTFDHISKKFIGTSASLTMSIVNDASEEYALRKGTRFVNQAGAIFRTQEAVFVPSQSHIPVAAVAEDLDMYQEIIGDRGNVPAGLKWTIPGLSPAEQKLVYGVNATEGTGGVTSYVTVLQEEDLESAKRVLQQDLLAMAKQLVEEERLLRNTHFQGKHFDILYYDELTRMTFGEFQLPREFLGEEVRSIPIEGEMTYTVFAYDAQEILDLLQEELLSHVQPGKELLADTLSLDRLVVHVIDYEDDLSWIKLTVDLSSKERYVLDPFSPLGVQFGKRVREEVIGLSKDDALRIVSNMPEVQKTEITLWPPWSASLSAIPSHITIEPQ
ncbi:hypothetical protein COU77_01245 [Candidatus Peregrinibacteria bacterium CG10_big_fil_rev_8_21_14_0_10_49_16]|nr:MAG: hypothetical protein COW95_01070 [Candidatus Peregrinibacteria bacterium CG22_combo_CG10-13_8_21_14_all_49_11]PIR52265.1 MAG: hypothetical protein COU77_01245 [Candidatus Peregrinibacteria bacterium CG10_big_fil_rev_8_21_14_0_10_49_16]